MSNSFLFRTVLVTFDGSTYRVIVWLLRFNLNVSAERCSIVGVVTTIDSTGSAQRWVCITINVFTRCLTLLEVRRRRVLRVVFKHLNRHTTIDLILKK